MIAQIYVLDYCVFKANGTDYQTSPSPTCIGCKVIIFKQFHKRTTFSFPIFTAHFVYISNKSGDVMIIKVTVIYFSLSTLTLNHHY